MRRWSLLLLELAVVGGGAAVAGLTLRHAGGEVGRAEGAQVHAAWPLGDFDVEPERLEIATSRAGTFMGMKDELLLDHIRAAPVAETKLNKGGSSISFRLTFGDGTRAAFKPTQINPQTVPRKEVAAYRLNRLLGMNGVPPAVMRTVHRDDLIGKLPPEAQFSAARINAETIFDEEGFTRGEVSYWIPVIVDSHLDTLDSVMAWWKWLSVGETVPADKVGLMAQLSSLLVFDMLQNNSDRFSGGNLMTSRDGKTLYTMDNTFGFQVDPEGHLKCRTYLMRSQKFSKRLVAVLRALDRVSIRAALADAPGALSDEEIASVLARRDVTLRYIDGLAARFGASKVLVFP